jgi:hypothetical protein
MAHSVERPTFDRWCCSLVRHGSLALSTPTEVTTRYCFLARLPVLTQCTTSEPVSAPGSNHRILSFTAPQTVSRQRLCFFRCQ